MNENESTLDIDSITESLSSLVINKKLNFSLIDIQNIIKIQKWFRGYILRKKRLPLMMYKIQKYLQLKNLILTNQNEDGRINSSIDEEYIINIIIEKFGEKIRKPKIRMWFDILAFDTLYGWIPINIKTSTIKTSDNTGNLAMCVYAYTDELLNIHNEKTYENGKMSEILIKKLKEKKYNKIDKKDYYFLIINKLNSKEIIINSVKGLTILTPNINNLPFQVNWSKNKEYIYKNIKNNIKLFLECLHNSKRSWREIFIEKIKEIKL